MTNLLEERLRWANTIRSAEMNRVVIVSPPSLLIQVDESPCLSPTVSQQKGTPVNGFGECIVCHSHRRLWSGVCGWCGADPEEKE